MTNREPLPHPLSEHLAALIAGRFRVLAEPARLRLLDVLRDGEADVGELAEAIGTTQQNVSKHLGVLHQAGLLTRRKHGTRVGYSIADPTVFEMCEAVCGGLQRDLQGRVAALATAS
jgi:DNA-binding transcriptional ArsR family regulator